MTAQNGLALLMNDGPESDLIQGLLRPPAYPHAVAGIRLIETHISWVILTGEFAYKLKKPLNLGFLDFSTLEKRRFLCQEELRLNRRLAPELYLDVVPVTGTAAAPRVGGEGAALEYALKMRQFEEADRLDHRLERGQTSTSDMRGLAELLAGFHDNADIADPDSEFGTPQRVREDMADNFRQIARHSQDADVLQSLHQVESWNGNAVDSLAGLMAERKTGGKVRECHGDLHLTNLVQRGDRIIPFDCIEFNPALRFIDVMSEVAFLSMDLVLRERVDLAFAFASQYLESGGDYAGVALLPLYSVYRSLVRAKVAAIRHAQGHDTAQRDRCRAHVALAKALTEPGQALLLITHGVSGSGKTWLSDRLIPALPALRVRSDVERKRLFSGGGAAAPGGGIYSREHTEATYARLAKVAATALSAGLSIIVDAAFLQRDERQRFHEIAEAENARFAILECTAPRTVLRKRVMHRAGEARDASDADLPVLDFQLEHCDDIGPAERPFTVTVATHEDPDPVEIARRLRS